MSSNSAIEWTKHTFNGWWGCREVHAGCANCYAKTFDKRVGGNHWGKGSPRRMILGEWGNPAKWNKAAAEAGEQHHVFCSSMCDVFEDYEGPVVDQQGKRVEFVGKTTHGVRAGQFDYENGKVYWSIPALRERIFQIIDETPNLLWLLLTKRPENVCRMVPDRWLSKWPENVMTGTSPCDQKTADKCIPELLKVPGRRFLSAEPLIGAVNLTEALYGNRKGINPATVDWVIVGGESGPGARPCDIDWVRSIVSQCKEAGVPVFVKQLGAKPEEVNTGDAMPMPFEFDDGGEEVARIYKPRDRKGGDMAEWPEDLRVREFPVLTPTPERK